MSQREVRTRRIDASVLPSIASARVAPWIVPREDEGPLLRSWQRCREAGMREHECINFEPVGRAQLAEIDERWQPLVQLDCDAAFLRSRSPLLTCPAGIPPSWTARLRSCSVAALR